MLLLALAIPVEAAARSSSRARIDVARSRREFKIQFKHHGQTRRAMVSLPKSFDRRQPLRVILNYHGYCDSPGRHAKYTSMAREGTKAGYIVIHPEALPEHKVSGKRVGLRRWDGMNRQGQDLRANDDVGFTKKLLGKLERQVKQQISSRDIKVDTTKVFATGFSNGAYFSYLLASELPQIAAIAAVSGLAAPKLRRPSHPVPTLHIHGKRDSFAPYRGWQPRLLNGNLNMLSVSRTVLQAAQNNGLGIRPASIERRSKNVKVYTWGEDAGAMVRLIQLKKANHSWPGAPDLVPGLRRFAPDFTSHEVNATKEILGFFNLVGAASAAN